jgi:hypothetical protein
MRRPRVISAVSLRAPREALEVLKKIVDVPGHYFWPDTLAPTDANAFRGAAFVGHRHATDAYLIADSTPQRQTRHLR